MAITYGMSVKEFWEDNPDLFWAYRFSYYERVRVEQEIFNNNAWLQGAYFCEAISVSLNNAFSKEKVEYSKHPYGFIENNIDSEEAKQEKIKAQVNEMRARISQVNAIRNGAIQQEIIKGENRV